MFEYTKHAKLKFRRKRIRELGIKRVHVERVVLKPSAVDVEKFPHIAVGPFSKELSLIVVYKKMEKAYKRNKNFSSTVYKVVTFFPAERGRYEDKILQRG